MNYDLIIVGCFFAILIIAVTFILFSISKEQEETFEKEKTEYNNLKCTDCGTDLILKKMDGKRRVYVCPNCSRVVIISDPRVDMDPKTGLFSYASENADSKT